MDNMPFTGLLEQEKSQNLEEKVIAYRQYAYNWFMAHYMEVLLNQRSYLNMPSTVNIYKMENMLRRGYHVALGFDSLKRFTLLGYINNQYSESDPLNTFNNSLTHFTSNDINWTIPDVYRPDKEVYQTELTATNTDGTFIVVRNKVVQYLSDFASLKMFASKYEEIEASYFSLIIQSKVSTAFQSDNANDESINQAVSKLYAGAPVMKVTKRFIQDLDILQIGATDKGTQMVTAIRDIKNDLITEVNNNFGIDGTGVTKQSGVSSDEVHSNDDIINAGGSIYINGIEEPLKLWNEYYGTNYHVYLNQRPQQDMEG